MIDFEKLEKEFNNVALQDVYDSSKLKSIVVDFDFKNPEVVFHSENENLHKELKKKNRTTLITTWVGNDYSLYRIKQFFGIENEEMQSDG